MRCVLRVVRGGGAVVEGKDVGIDVAMKLSQGLTSNHLQCIENVSEPMLVSSSASLRAEDSSGQCASFEGGARGEGGRG